MKRSTCASGSGRPLSLDRVLRREDEERVGDRVGGRTDRHLALLHDLEERRLHLGGSAVDLVGEEEVAEHGPELDVEVARAGAVNARAHQVGRHEVGGELNAVERAVEHVGEGLDCQGLRKAGDALDEQVPAGEQPDEHALEHHLLADDYSLHLEEGGLEVVPHVADRDRRLLGLCHCLAPCVAGRRPLNQAELKPS